jgi:hypothetical protein
MTNLTTTVVAAAATLSAASVLWPPPEASPSRQASVGAVQLAVLSDLLSDARPGFAGHSNPVLERDRVVCASVWHSSRVLTSGSEVDPGPEVLARLRASGRRVYPGSACTLSNLGLRLAATGERAVLIGVGTPEWTRSSLAKVEGVWYLGPLYAAGSRYTVSFADGRWRVDTAKFTWVS